MSAPWNPLDITVILLNKDLDIGKCHFAVYVPKCIIFLKHFHICGISHLSGPVLTKAGLR